jgi:CRISPR-associated protein Cas2
MSLYAVIAYDTPSDRRRRRMVKVLEAFGERRQYSVFEARLTKAQWTTLKTQLLKLIEPSEDNLVAYFLAPEALERTWRVGNEEIRPLAEPDFV